MIAIDPGPLQSACVRYRDGRILFREIMPNPRALEWVRLNRDEPLAIEMIASYGMAVGEEVFDTCVWIGRLVEAHHGQHRFLKRMEVKMHLCYDSKAKDANVRQALVDRFGEKGTKKNPGKLYGFAADMYAALAVALTAVETRGTWRTHG